MAAENDVPWWRSPQRLFSLTIAAIGAGGIPDNIKGWGNIIGFVANMIDHETARWTLFILGFGYFLFANRLSHFWQKKTAPMAVPSSTVPARSTARVVQPKPEQSPPAVQVARPQPRKKPFSYNAATIADLMLFRQMVRAGTARSDDPADLLPPMTCPQCEGNGLLWSRYQSECPNCGGTGELPGELLQYPKCILCDGNGLKFGRYQADCPACNGLGVRIPKQA
jgi:hypothetical protein